MVLKYKTVAHKQLVAFTITVPLIFVLIELSIILSLPNGKELWAFIFVGVQALLMWFICFAIYSYAYRTIEVNEQYIKSKKTEITWDNIQKIELREIKLMQYSLLPTLTFSSMAYFYGIKGDVIGIAMTKRNFEILVNLGKDKSQKVAELNDKIKV